MPNMSQITIAGHLARDAETKQVGASTVTEWTMAVNHKKGGDESVMWFRCALWGKRGEGAAPYLTKGSAVIATGAFHVREYEGKNGRAYSLEVNVSEFTFLGGGGKGEPRAKSAKPAPAPNPADDDDLPF